jgi:replicative DNA helicase
MDSIDKYRNDNDKFTEISASLTEAAKNLDIPIVTLSQLSRDFEKRVLAAKDKEKVRPNLSDLRGSGSIEQDAFSVIFLNRPEVYDEENPDYKGICEFYVAKVRNGDTGIIDNLNFNGECAKFEETL